MLKTPELAMNRSHKVTTICNGQKRVWDSREDAKSHFLEAMMSSDGRSMTDIPAFIFNYRTV